MESLQMRKFLAMLLGLAGLFGMIATATAEGSHTPDQAKALVQRAAEYLKREGKDKALAAFNDPKGEFVDGDLYLVVLDAVDGKLTMLAHGANKALRFFADCAAKKWPLRGSLKFAGKRM